MITITKVIAVLVFLTGVLGLVLGEQSLGGLVNIDIFEDIAHLITGILLWYAVARRGTRGAKNMLWILGIVYALLGIIAFVTPTVYGLTPDGLSWGDNLIHLVVGAILIYFALRHDRAKITAK
jgi:hypothetical protein